MLIIILLVTKRPFNESISLLLRVKHRYVSFSVLLLCSDIVAGIEPDEEDCPKLAKCQEPLLKEIVAGLLDVLWNCVCHQTAVLKNGYQTAVLNRNYMVLQLLEEKARRNDGKSIKRSRPR
ncbi:hypothetical protein RIF29_32625 [Crotalaria pallida]|uniref:Uncharacterized protein n=1 Tax=Crotalaria pallida TaxID=3830 RepID=A0AAN9EJ47_CROPI